jgi:hypothetical protein
MLAGGGIEFANRPPGMNPAQAVWIDVELTGVAAGNDCVGKQAIAMPAFGTSRLPRREHASRRRQIFRRRESINH